MDRCKLDTNRKKYMVPGVMVSSVMLLFSFYTWTYDKSDSFVPIRPAGEYFYMYCSNTVVFLNLYCIIIFSFRLKYERNVCDLHYRKVIEPQIAKC